VKGALRIALTYFAVVPLQGWLVGFGALLLLGAAVALSGNPGAGARNAGITMLIFGGLLTVGLTTLLAGGSMRSASSPRVTHLLPNGRRQMLLGATLAITLLAALATLVPLLGDMPSTPGAKRSPFSGIPPLTVFTTCWSAVALLWVGMFVVTGSRLLSVLIPFIPLAMIKLGRNLQGLVPDSLTLLGASLVVWAAFSLWYMRVPSIRRLSVYGPRPTDGSSSAMWNRLQAMMFFTRGGLSSTRAMQQMLLGPSLFGHFMIGVGWILVAAFMLLLFSGFMSGSDHSPPSYFGAFIFAPVILVTWGSMGFALTRRARILWLRAGLDRIALFRRAERSGLLAGAMAQGIVMVAFVLFALSIWPEDRGVVLLICAVLAAFCACLFYAGMSLTRGWVAVDFALCAGLLLLFAFTLIVLPRWAHEQRTFALASPFAMTLLAVVLRWRARHRWRALDWRVARMLQMPRRA
jgi:hypothetical protein